MTPTRRFFPKLRTGIQLGVVVFGSFPAGAAERGRWDGELGLRQSVATAVTENLSLRIRRSLTGDARQDIEIERSVFDLVFTSEGLVSERVQPVASSALDGALQPESASERVASGVSKRFSTGATISVRSTVLDRGKTNSSFARLNPEYNSQLSLNLRQPLLKNRGKAANLEAIRQAGLGERRANIEVLAELNTVLLRTEQAYWTLVATVAAEEIRRNALELAGLLTEEVEERRKVNLATPVDVLEAKSAAATKREALLIAQNATKDAADVLFREMGILKAVEPGALVLEPLPEAAVDRPDADESFKRAIGQAPEMMVLRNVLNARELALAQVRRERYPQLDFTFSTGVMGRGNTQGASLEQLRERNGNFWRVGLELSLPWGFRRERARVAKARGAVERSLLNLRDVELQLLADIREAARSIALAGERVEAAKVTVELNTLRFEQQKEERKEGEATMRDLLEAQEEMEDAELRVIQAKVDLLRSTVALAQLEGALPGRYGIELEGGTSR